MPLRWDPPLVRHLARELDATLGGARLRALRLDGATRVASLLFREATLTWPLHPTQGALRILDPTEPATGDLPLAGRVRRVHAPEDERLLVLEVLPARGRKRAVDIVVELLGNQWNLVVTEGPEAHIRHVLVRREDGRPLRVGGTYRPPEPNRREGCREPIAYARWAEILDGLSGPARRRALVSTVAWTSSINADALVGASGAPGAAALRDGLTLWRHLAFEEVPPSPVLLETPRGVQPYPWPLPGTPSTPVPSLLDAFAGWAEGTEERGSAAGDEALLPPRLVAELDAALDRALRRTTSLQAQLDAVEEPGPLRAAGDLVLARLTQVPEGVAEVTLEDFDGQPVTLPLDPRLAPHENADAFYERAARAERAQERLPHLLDEARNRARELEQIAEGVRSGEVTAAQVRAAVPEGERPPDSAGRGAGPALPYRRYVSSGGLEIRVGRGAKHNDALTFHHSSPGDVWLHARHAAGAHVVLRWGRDEKPPARDLQEAAVLAAVNSQARTSSSVAVDWTFRKYVRKPRGSPPGRVALQRAHTLFVTPDADLADRLADDDAV